MIRPGTSLSKQKKRASVQAAKVVPGKKTEISKPNLFDYLDRCDYVGAITILQFDRKAKTERAGGTAMWLAYAAFHNGDYRLALETYEDMLVKHAQMGRTRGLW